MVLPASCWHLQEAECISAWAASLEKGRVLAKRAFRFLQSSIVFHFTRWPPGLLRKNFPKTWMLCWPQVWIIWKEMILRINIFCTKNTSESESSTSPSPWTTSDPPRCGEDEKDAAMDDVWEPDAEACGAPSIMCESMSGAEPPRNVSGVSQALRDRVFLSKRNFKRFSECLPQDSPFGELQVSKWIRRKFLQNSSRGKYLNAHVFDFKTILFLKAMWYCHQICQCFKTLFHHNENKFTSLTWQWSIHLHCRRLKRRRFDSQVGKIPWRRTWQPTPVFLPGEIPETEEPGGLQSTGSDTAATTHTYSLTHVYKEKLHKTVHTSAMCEQTISSILLLKILFLLCLFFEAGFHLLKLFHNPIMDQNLPTLFT